MTINQISVFLENKVGQLAQVGRTLAENNISLVTLALAETQDFGIVRLIVNDTEKAETALRANKFLVKTTPVVAVVVPDRPGGMAHVVTQLSEKGCDIEYSYAFAGRPNETAVLVFRFKNEAASLAALEAAGLATLDETMLMR